MPSMSVGEEAIKITLKRGLDGLKVHIQVHPAVEELTKSWGGEDVSEVDVRSIGRYWQLAKGQSDPLMAYSLSNRMPPIHATPDGESSYRVDQVGGPMVCVDGSINMSMLRLVGTSKSGGVEFLVPSLISETEMIRVAKVAKQAASKICKDFLVPIEFTVKVSIAEKH